MLKYLTENETVSTINNHLLKEECISITPKKEVLKIK